MDNTMQWYTLYVSDGSTVPDVVKQIKEITADEPDAVVEQRHTHVYVKTGLTWGFLRETLPNCLVCVAESKNRSQS